MDEVFTSKDYLAEARERVTEQLKGKPVFDKYLQTMILDGGLQDTLKSLMTERSIDTAAGAQLDIIGSIVGQPRELISTDLFDYFAFEGYPAAGSYGDLDNTGVGGGYYYGIGEPLSGNTVLNDEQYRLFIKAKIAKNTTRATPDEMLEFISFVFGATINNVISEGTAEYTIMIGKELSRFERALFTYKTSKGGYDSYFVPKPAGVRISYGQFPSDNYFGFQGAPGAKGYGDLNDSSVGGKWAALF